MKKRRIAIASFLMLAVLVMGIGFAAVADTLFITGAVRANSDATSAVFDQKVYFSAAVKNAGNGSAAGAVDTIEITGTEVGAVNDTVDFRVNTLALINQYTQFKITIKNESDQYDAKVELIEGQPTGNVENVVKIEYSTLPDSINGSAIVCPAGGTVDVYVTVTLLCSPDADLESSFTCNLKATSQPKADNAED